MGIDTEFLIDYNNKRVYHDAGTTVYSVNALYSYLMDTFDEQGQLDDSVPMSAQTPTAYTMINGWHIDDESVKYLYGGAIETSGYKQGVAPDSPTGIRVLTFAAGGYVSCVPGDRGLPVVGAVTTDSGKLLAYNNTTRKWWVRSDATDDNFDQVEAITITGGTGGGTTAGASGTGEELYSNLYTLGTISSTPYPQIYIFQSGAKIAEWSTLTNWDRGHIDILVKVKEVGVLISLGVVNVFARQETTLFDNFEIDLSAGGRNAVPLSTANDLNNGTGEYYLFYDAEVAAFSTMHQIVTGGTSGAKAELIAATDWGTEGVLTLVDVQGTFTNNEGITGSVDGNAVVNGTLGDTYLLYDAEGGDFTVGQVLTGGTSGAKRNIVGLQDDGVTGKLNLKVRGSPTTADYLAYANNEAITDPVTGAALANGNSTTIISGWSNIVVAFVNGTVTHGAITGTFTDNEIVTWDGGTKSGVFIKETSGTMTLGNCSSTLINTKTILGSVSGATTVASADLVSAHTTPKAFPRDPVTHDYDVVVDCDGRTVSQVYEYLKFVARSGSAYNMYTVVGGVITVLTGNCYQIAYTGYTPIKAAPFGSFAGGIFFGAQGIWLEDMDVDDAMSYQLIDSSGTTRDPPTVSTITISSVVAGDRVGVYRTLVGVIDKATYTSHATNNTLGSGTFEVQANIDSDTPDTGFLRTVDTSTATEQRYEYSSWTGKIFTLVGTLDRTYDGTDKAYVPFIDEEAISTSVSVIVVYASDRDVLIRVRKKGIIPFETTGQVVTTGLSVSAIRTTDTIVT
jgi:hypothetical protein